MRQLIESLFEEPGSLKGWKSAYESDEYEIEVWRK